jgi:hypothetical protein
MSPLLEESPAPVALGNLNEGEGRVLRTRRRLGLTLAPLLFAVLLATPMPALRPEAHRLAGVTAAVVVLWITEALPMVR